LFHALKAEPWSEGRFGPRPVPSNDRDLRPDGNRVAMAPHRGRRPMLLRTPSCSSSIVSTSCAVLPARRI